MKRTSTLCCTPLLSVLCGAQERIPTLDSLNITEQTAPSDWDSYIAS